MTLGEKIKELREANNMLQRQLAAKLEMGDGYLSKIESDQKVIRREHLKTISILFKYPYNEFAALWIGNKIYELGKDEQESLNALKVAEEQIKYNNKKL